MNETLTSGYSPDYKAECDRLMEENRKLKKEVEELKETLIGMCKTLYTGGADNDR